MDKEYQFFICNNSKRWSEGTGKNIDITDDGLELIAATEYIFKDSFSMATHLKEIFLSAQDNKVHRVSVSNDGETYILDRYNCVWHWRYLDRQLHRIYQPSSDEHNFDFILGNGQIVVLLSSDQTYIRLIDVKIGQIIRDIVVHDYIPGKLLTLELTQTHLYWVHDDQMKIEILAYEIKTGQLASYANFEYRVPDVIKKCILRQTKSTFALALQSGNELLVINKNNVFSMITTDDELLDFYPEKDHYYLSMLVRKKDHPLVTSLFRTDEQLNKVYTVKETYGIGRGLFVGPTGMYQWFRQRWALNYYALGKVYKKETTIKDDIVTGHYLSRCFDSYIENKSWHRYLIDFVAGHNTRVKISYYATDDNRLIHNNKRLSIQEFMNLEDVSFEEKRKQLCHEGYYKSESLNAKDGLFQNTKGRYLWFYIELMGTTMKSPLVRSVQMYYKRQSYLRYLPEIYQENPESAEFLERFLSIYESYMSDMEEQIDHMHILMDPNLNSGDTLRWLGTWLGFEFDDSWHDDQVRQMIRMAAKLYKIKGTANGIKLLLEIYLHEKPYIIESFDIKGQSEHLFDDNPFVFYVLVSKKNVDSKIKIANVMTLLNWMKPVHTEAKLIILEDTILLGDHCYLGMNTVVSGYDSLTLNDAMYLLNDTVIYDEMDEDRLGKYARLDHETFLK